jgi:predicted heme/steroid binding protein/uncharacterized membrane protein
MAKKNQEIDLESLKKSDGKEGRPTYVAYNGKVYDVSTSKRWQDGRHMNIHYAGQDLTSHLPMAPHGEEVFDRVDMVGQFIKPAMAEPEEKGSKELLFRLYKKFHPHPITVHFPIALFIFSVIMHLLYVLLGRPHTVAASGLYAFIFASIATPVAIGAGFFSWWLNYNATMTPIFRKKIVASLVLLFVAAICLFWRYVDPGVIDGSGIMTWLYYILVISTWPLVTFLGYQGSKITFPK